jgi:hypothetical protein
MIMEFTDVLGRTIYCTTDAISHVVHSPNGPCTREGLWTVFMEDGTIYNVFQKAAEQVITAMANAEVDHETDDLGIDELGNEET